MSHASATTRDATLSSAFAASRHETEITTLVFHATSLEVASTLMVSTEPRNTRELKAHEVNAVCQLFSLMHIQGQVTVPVGKEAVSSAIYFGRTRENRLVGSTYSDEPCLYLVFPHIKNSNEFVVRALVKRVLEPAMTQAYRNYDVPQVVGGALRATPPVFREKKDLMRGLMLHHEIRTHLNENWNAAQVLPREESTATSRQQLHRLIWEHMQKAVAENHSAHMFRDMLLLVVVPRVEHTVATDHTCGGDFNIALREGLSFYDNDLNMEFVGEGRVLYSGSCHLARRTDLAGTLPTLPRSSAKHFFAK